MGEAGGGGMRRRRVGLREEATDVRSEGKNTKQECWGRDCEVGSIEMGNDGRMGARGEVTEGRGSIRSGFQLAVVLRLKRKRRSGVAVFRCRSTTP